MSPRRFDADGRLTRRNDLDRWGYETEDHGQQGYRQGGYSDRGGRRRTRARLDESEWPAEYASPRRQPTQQSHRAYPRNDYRAYPDSDFGDDYGPPTARRAKPGRLAGMVWLALGLGLLIDGGAVSVSPSRYTLGLWLFWGGLLVPFVTFVLVLAAGRPSRALRQFTVVLLGLYPTLIYRVNGPFVLRSFDEHLHERTLTDLLHGSGLFAPNPLLPVSPYYPGLELFTGSLARLTGLPAMFAMNLVPLLSRLLLILAVYHAALAVTRSYRRASLVVIFYAASPGFYLFNSIFSYQTLALTLGIGGITLLYRAQLAREADRARALSAMGTLALVATVITHHATSWMVLAFLIAWSVAERPSERRIVVRATWIMAACVVAWTAVVWKHVSVYMGPMLAAVVTQTSVFFGHGQTHLFTDSAGTSLPLWQQAALVIYAVLCAGAAVIAGFAVLRTAFRSRNRVLVLVALLSIIYPVTLAAHFAIADRALAGQIGNRATAFMFFPVALCLAMVVPNPKMMPRLDRQKAAIFLLSLVGGATIAYVGGVTLGAGPDYGYLPGHYLVGADSRTQDPQTLAAVRWAATHLPAGSRIVADRTPEDLLAARARLWPVFGLQNGHNPAVLYFSKTWNNSLDKRLKYLEISYIYVDTRLSSSAPQVGAYFWHLETPKPTRLSLADLTKFNQVPGLTTVYHHGPITIYDTSNIGTVAMRTGYTGNRPMGPSSPVSVILGAVVGAVLLALRRRLRWVAHTARSVGVTGTALGAIAVIIFVSAVLFGMRLMPGPSFTLGAAEMVLVTMAVQRRLTGRPFFPRWRHAPRVGPLVVLGSLAAAFGLVFAFHAGWTMDVADVNRILHTVASAAAHHTAS